jgi:hypothetical protein
VKILVDADACPVRGILREEATRRGVPLLMVVSMAHDLEGGNGIEVLRVDTGFQSVDIAIVNRAEEKDIVVTSDYGLAAMVLGKGSRAISPSGKIFSPQNMDLLLEKRHAAARTRRGGGKTKGPRARTRDDDVRFRDNLLRLLEREKPEVSDP